MKNPKELIRLSDEERAEIYNAACKAFGLPAFEPKTVKVDSLGGFTQTVIDAHKDLENQTEKFQKFITKHFTFIVTCVII